MNTREMLAALGIANAPPTAPMPAADLVTVTPAHMAHARGALARASAAVRGAASGTRNAMLTREARGLGNLIASGTLDRDEASAALLDAAMGSGLTRAEALDTIRRNLAAGMRTPRDLSGVGAGERGDAASSGGADAKNAWRDPDPLPDPLLPVPPFDLDMLPPPFRAWAGGIAERTGAPLDFIGVSILTACAGTVGRRMAIRPFKYDTWAQPPVAWALLVGPPSSGKSPAMREALRPVRRLEAEAGEDHARRMQDHRAAALLAEAKGKKIKRQLEAAVGKDGDEMSAELLARELEAVEREREDAPKAVRFIVSDSTPEKLADLLSDNPSGLILIRDELTGLIDSFEREGNQAARAFYLETWTGNGAFTVDRIGRGTQYCRGLCLSMLGGIQPGPLRARLLNGRNREADGFLARFSLAVWPDSPRHASIPDRPPDREIESAAFATFTHLAGIDAQATGATVPEDPHAVPYLTFDAEAQERFDEWYLDLKRALLDPRERFDSDGLQEHAGKYQSIVPALALVDHLADGRTGPIRIDTLGRALRLAAYFEAHARRLYHAGGAADLDRAHRILDKIKAGDLPPTFTARTVQLKNWGGLGSSADIIPALDLLSDAGYLRAVEARPGPKGGRPTVTYETHPRITKKI